MDTITAPSMAKRLGVSLPTMHRILDRAGVPRTGRGIPRFLPASTCERILRTHSPLRDGSEILVLAAVQSRLHGVGSAREVARLVHISPTTAGRTLHRLVDAGLIVRRTIRAMWAGAVVPRERYQIDATRPDWPALRPVVDRIGVAALPILRSNTVPKQYWHLFWNADPKALRVDEHGAYIARRMLSADSLEPALWALENVPPEQIMTAIEGRGADPKTRAFAINHLRAAQEAGDPQAGRSTGEAAALKARFDDFQATRIDGGTVNGRLGVTKIQVLDASGQKRLAAVTSLAGIRIAAVEDILAMKLKVIMDRGELRDYFDLMCIEKATDLNVVSGIRLYLARYSPDVPEQHVYRIVKSLGYLDDVADDPGLPVSRAEIAAYWSQRQAAIASGAGLR